MWPFKKKHAGGTITGHELHITVRGDTGSKDRNVARAARLRQAIETTELYIKQRRQIPGLKERLKALKAELATIESVLEKGR